MLPDRRCHRQVFRHRQSRPSPVRRLVSLAWAVLAGTAAWAQSPDDPVSAAAPAESGAAAAPARNLDSATTLSDLGRSLGSQVFIDARSTSFSRDMNRQEFEGEVVVIGLGTLIAADRVTYDQAAGVVEASGHIVVLNRTQVFLGDGLFYHLGTGDFKLSDATMLTNDTAEIERITREVLGFTPRDADFLQNRARRLQELEAHKARLRRESLRQSRAGEPLHDDLIDRYAMLLERERLISAQQAPGLAGVSEERRESLRRRRQFWEAGKQVAPAGPASPVLSTAYFHLEGEEISRVEGNDYAARNALFTPCYCGRDESPAWAFRADEVEARVGGYADMRHAVLEIKGIPVLYLPYVKVPIKDRRQSGFLLPVIGFEQRSGTIYSQPVYVDFGPSADATLTTDIYEKRGTRLGVEYRVQQRRNTGWELRLEGMRDRQWLADRALREELEPAYRDGLNYALSDQAPPAAAEDFDEYERLRWRLLDRGYWQGIAPGNQLDGPGVEQLRGDIDRGLGLPENTWRGAYGWRGVSYIAPRLSVVSNGEIMSDHRYAEELDIPDEYRDAFFGGSKARAFSDAKGQLHLDGRDYYAGLGMRYGDNMLLSERFEGQQVPLRLKMQTRVMPLLPEGSPVPVYSQVQVEQYRISEIKPADAGPADGPTLGDGFWRRAKVDAVTPLVTDSVIQVNQFADGEGRYIEHGGLTARRSEVRSWRAGLELRLPIDGKGELPGFLQDHPEACRPDSGADPLSPECVAAADPEGQRRFVHHLMDWRLRFSTRPAVVKRGLYTNAAAADGGTLAYFASDRVIDPNSPIDSDVPEEERMKLHRRVAFSTDHVWRLFRRDARRTAAPAGGAGNGSDVDGPAAMRERARHELLLGIDRPVTDAGQVVDKKSGTWLVDRYELHDSYYETPLEVHGDIAYDFLDARERERQQAANREVDGAVTDLESVIAAREAELATARAAGEPEDRIRGLETELAARRAERDRLAGGRQLVLAEPWKNPNLSATARLAGWSLSSTASYSIYLRTTSKMDFRLIPPGLLETNLSFGYAIAKEYVPAQDDFRITTARTLGVASSLADPVTLNMALTRKRTAGQDEDYTTDHETSIGLAYNSPAKCWGLEFLRQKKFAYDERSAAYLLRLNVVFMGQQRSLPNMSPGIEREAKSTGDDG